MRRLMLIMGIESLAPKPGTSKRQPKHPVYPYLLRGMTIDRPNQVWATDHHLYPPGTGIYVTGVELSQDLTTWFSYYSENRLHSSLDKQTPNEAYFRGLEKLNRLLDADQPNNHGPLLISPSGCLTNPDHLMVNIS